MITSIVLAVFIRQVAIVIAIFICFAAGYNIKKRFLDKKKDDEAAEATATGQQAYNTMDAENPAAVTVVAAEVVSVK